MNSVIVGQIVFADRLGFTSDWLDFFAILSSMILKFVIWLHQLDMAGKVGQVRAHTYYFVICIACSPASEIRDEPSE